MLLEVEREKREEMEAVVYVPSSLRREAGALMERSV